MKTSKSSAARTSVRVLMVALASLGFVAPVGIAQDQSAPPPVAPPPAQPRRRPPPPPPPPPVDTTPANPPGMPMSNPPGPRTTPAPTQTTTGGQEGAERRREPELGPYVKRAREREYVLTVDVRVRSDNLTAFDAQRGHDGGPAFCVQPDMPFEFETMGMVWPLLPISASSALDIDSVSGVLRLDGHEMTRDHATLRGYQAGVLLARWDVKSPQSRQATARQVFLSLTQTVSAWRTEFDEATALQVPWPKGSWPRDAASALQPQMFVEQGFDSNNVVRPYEDAPLSDALRTWLAAINVSEPSRINPAALAKVIAGRVWDGVQTDARTTSGLDGRSGDVTTRTGEFAGVIIQPPAETLRSGRGTAADTAALLTALYRKAGIPARIVIGHDTGGSRNITGRQRSVGLRYWVEFALYDEAANTINWVPVDVVRMRRATSRPPAIERPWRYFGTHDELDEVVPFAFHFHPPTDVVSYGAPAFWGWFVTPTPPVAATQTVRFNATTAPRRGGQPPQR